MKITESILRKIVRSEIKKSLVKESPYSRTSAPGMTPGRESISRIMSALQIDRDEAEAMYHSAATKVGYDPDAIDAEIERTIEDYGSFQNSFEKLTKMKLKLLLKLLMHQLDDADPLSNVDNQFQNLLKQTYDRNIVKK